MKYSKAIDLLIASVQYASAGKMGKASNAFKLALAEPQLMKDLAALDQVQDKLLAHQTKKAVAAVKRSAKGKQVASPMDDDFQRTVDQMTVEQSALEDILELPSDDEDKSKQKAGTTNGQGESEGDTDGDDESDLDFTGAATDCDFSDLGDLTNLNGGYGAADLDSTVPVKKGKESAGGNVPSQTSTNPDLKTGPANTQETPEGQPAKMPAPPKTPEDTTVVSAMGRLAQRAAARKQRKAAPDIAAVNRAHKNLAALARAKSLTSAARVALRT